LIWSKGASPLRGDAYRLKAEAADPQYESCRTIFENAAKLYEDLAGKLTRIAPNVP